MSDYIKSPLNYTGRKYKLLEQIEPLFPKNINILYDVFCGGLDVSMNVKSNKVVSNDIIKPMIDMFRDMSNYDYNIFNDLICNIINKYGLSKYNKDGYLKLREDYNNTKNSVMLFVLICFCYNNQIRFNSNWNFNRAFGKRCYNESIQENLKIFMNRLDNMNITFSSIDFQLFDYSKITKDDYVYIDPPYLITSADYSIQASWSEDKERKLFDILDELNNREIRFGLSNVITHNGKKNDILIEWSKKYNTYYLNKDYKNCNAVKKCKNTKTQEVLITNY